MMKKKKFIVGSLLSLTILSTSSFVSTASEDFDFDINNEIQNDLTNILWKTEQNIETKENEVTYLEEELRLLSAIIYCEAGNQCEAGQQAVGIVVMNRVADEANFGSTVEEVIYEPGQFRPRNNGKLNKALRRYDIGTLPQDCIEAAKYALLNNKTVTYNGQEINMENLYYFARNMKNEVLRIQDHDFK